MENVHSIAVELESFLRDEFGFNDRPIGTIFDADAIESYMFYDDMVLLLHKKGTGDFNKFIDDNYEHKGKNMNEITNCEEIFEKFKRLLLNNIEYY